MRWILAGLCNMLGLQNLRETAAGREDCGG